MAIATIEKPVLNSSVKEMERRMVVCAEKVIARILEVRAGLVPRSFSLQSDFRARLARLAELAKQQGYQEKQIESAQFALVALIDESVRLEAFAERLQWDRNPLQHSEFDTNNAGEEFYDYLSSLMRDPEQHTPADTDVIEVYYLCFLIGFVGITEKARSERKTVEEYLQKKGRLHTHTLSPQGLGNILPPLPKTADWPPWARLGMVAWVVLLILLLLLLKYVLALSHLVPAARELLR